MNRNKLVVLVGALCAVVFAFSMVSTAMAAEDFKRWSIGTQIMYLDTDTDSIGADAANLDVSAEDLMTMLSGRRGRIKTFLLNQKNLAGIGNAYIHDILFLAKIHPLRGIHTLSEAEIQGLHDAIHRGLQPSIDKGGAFYEMNLFGERGGFLTEDIIIGYREGEPCPNCTTPIEKIKVGSTSSFICPTCQSI